MANINFGENLRDLRLLKGISQDAMAEHLGVSQTTYSKMERYSNIPDQDQVYRIAKIFNISPAQLMQVLKEGVSLPGTTAIDPSGSTDESFQPNQPGFMVSAREFLLGNMGIVILITVGYFFVTAVFEAAKGASSGLGASDATMMKVGFIAAFIATVVILYMIIRNRRKYRK